MMIAAVDAVHERNQIRRAIRQAQAKRPLIEGDRVGYVARENKDVRQATRTNQRRFRARGGPGLSCGYRNPMAFRLPVRRYFRPDLHLDQHTLVVAEPEPVGLKTWRRIDQ